MMKIIRPVFRYIIYSTVFLFSLNLPARENRVSFWNTLEYYLYKPIALFFPHYEKRKIIYETETQYFNICVEEDESGKRHLVFLPRKGSQSVFNPNDPDKIFSNYIKYSLLAFPALKRDPENILFIGMGGGIMPMIVRKMYPDVKIDIVEIDNEIPGIAEKYFGFKPDAKIRIFIEDGRVFVNKSKNKYDVIFIDVYNAYNIPFQFTTKEFYEQIKRILSCNGISAVNIANMGKKNFISSELRTILSVFPETLVFLCPDKTNYVPLINNDQFYDFRELENSVDNYKFQKYSSVDFKDLLKNCLSKQDLKKITDETDLILTDDYAPVALIK